MPTVNEVRQYCKRRAAKAEDILKTHYEAADLQASLTDLLTDMMHLENRRMALDWCAALESARMHFMAEDSGAADVDYTPPPAPAKKVAKPKPGKLADPMPHPSKPGVWIYTEAQGGALRGESTIFVSAKERQRDIKRRAKKSAALDTANRNAKLNALGITQAWYSWTERDTMARAAHAASGVSNAW